MRQLKCYSWYHVQSGNKWPLPAWLLLRLCRGLRIGVGCRAGLGTLLTGCLGVCVPCPIPVGTVARGSLINGHTLTRWDHPVSSKTVGTYNRSRIKKREGGGKQNSLTRQHLCLLLTCNLSFVPNVKQETILRDLLSLSSLCPKNVTFFQLNMRYGPQKTHHFIHETFRNIFDIQLVTVVLLQAGDGSPNGDKKDRFQTCKPIKSLTKRTKSSCSCQRGFILRSVQDGQTA